MLGQPTECITVQHMEPSKLQFLALQFADKTAQFVETNERVLDSRTGSYGYKQDNWQDGRGGREYRRPWVERSDRYGHSHGGRSWHGGDRGDWGDRGGYGGGGYGGGGRGRPCLLYTSPSPRDGLLSRMPSSA